MVILLVPCTSWQTCSVPGGIRSLRPEENLDGTPRGSDGIRMVPGVQKRYVTKKLLFGAPSSRSIERPYDDHGRNGIPCRRLSYSVTTWEMCCTILFAERGARYVKTRHQARNGCNTVKGSVLHCGYYIKKTRRKGRTERNTYVLLVQMKTRRNELVRHHDCSATRVGQRLVGPHDFKAYPKKWLPILALTSQNKNKLYKSQHQMSVQYGCNLSWTSFTHSRVWFIYEQGDRPTDTGSSSY